MDWCRGDRLDTGENDLVLLVKRLNSILSIESFNAGETSTHIYDDV